MKLGIHAFAFCSNWDMGTGLPIISKVNSMDMDFIEIPLMDLPNIEPKKIREHLETEGLGVVTSTVLSRETNIDSPDVAIRERGVKYLKACVDANYEMGSS